jgi:hypothetical protein
VVTNVCVSLNIKTKKDMKTQEPKLPTQSKEPKSIDDYTPYELAMIDQYQTNNRGFDGDEVSVYDLDWED